MPCALPRMAVLMPTTSPLMLISGPPELPKLIAASVWMKFSNDRGVGGVAAVAVLVRSVMDLNLAGVLDDVVVGQDVAVRRDDESGTAGDLLPLVVFVVRGLLPAGAALLARVREEELERIDERM